MPNITLSLPEEIYKMMKKHTQIRWSEVARKAILEEVKKLALMEKITSKSKLTFKDVEEIDKKIKKGLYQSFKR